MICSRCGGEATVLISAKTSDGKKFDICLHCLTELILARATLNSATLTLDERKNHDIVH